MIEGVTLRPGRAGDGLACARIHDDWITATPWMPCLRSRAQIEATFEDKVLKHRKVTVAEKDGAVVGFLALDEASGEITSFFVGPHGHGIGTALIAAAKQGREALWLWTFQADEGARRFYARHGFAELERTEGENDEHLPDVRLGWRA